MTPLILAAGRGHVEPARDLLARGADAGIVCDVRVVGEVTALELAEARGFAEVV